VDVVGWSCSCSRRLVIACVWECGQEMVPGGQAEAATLYYNGCRHGHARSCMAQAQMLNQAGSVSVPIPASRVRAFGDRVRRKRETST